LTRRKQGEEVEGEGAGSSGRVKDGVKAEMEELWGGEAGNKKEIAMVLIISRIRILKQMKKKKVLHLRYHLYCSVIALNHYCYSHLCLCSSLSSLLLSLSPLHPCYCIIMYTTFVLHLQVMEVCDCSTCQRVVHNMELPSIIYQCCMHCYRGGNVICCYI